MLPDAAIERVLVVVAHPDDVDFGAAGTVAGWTSAGIDVIYCIVTNGDAGGFDATVTRAEMASMRQAEQRAAAKVLGVEDVRFLDWPDGRVVPSLELRRDVARVIRQVRPDRVLTQSPERNFARIYASHPDHLATGEATLCAVYPDARNEFAFPELLDEGLAPHTVREVWLMAPRQPDHAVDVTEHVERKLEALRCHESQHQDPASLEPRLRAWMESVADQAGLPAGRMAEAFQVVSTV